MVGSRKANSATISVDKLSNVHRIEAIAGPIT